MRVWEAFDLNTLYYGDNLDILKRYVKDETVDLVYLDPPFNSSQDYNVLFQERDGTRSAAQIRAFKDTWVWDESAARALQEIVEKSDRVSRVMMALRTFLGDTDMLAYLAMMAPRLVELRRVLKPTGSIYLHCDPTASHYLKLIMDAVFGPMNFRNEVIWKRTSSHGSPKRWGPVHDVLLFYTKTDRFVWNQVRQAYDTDYLQSKYGQSDEGGPFMLDNLTGAGTRDGESGQPWRGFNPTQIGRHWAVPTAAINALISREKAQELTVQQSLDLLQEQKLLYWPKKGKKDGIGLPRFKRYLGEGVSIQDVVTDIPPINSQAQERLGYPTQKPEHLIDRIVKASSNEGDLVLDPFCGCGTAVAVSQKLKRQWIGIDITHLAITLIRHRIKDSFGDSVKFKIVGEPVSLPDAETLAANDPYQFQWWALAARGVSDVCGSRL